MSTFGLLTLSTDSLFRKVEIPERAIVFKDERDLVIQHLHIRVSEEKGRDWQCQNDESVFPKS